jgi:hypothetical protein
VGDERLNQIDEWRRLTLEDLKAQVAPLGKPHDRGRDNEGINETSRALGIERTEVQRAKQVGEIPEPVKAAYRTAGLADNQSAILKIAKEAKASGVEGGLAKVAAKAAPRDPEFDRYQIALAAYDALTAQQKDKFHRDRPAPMPMIDVIPEYVPHFIR